MFLLHLSTFGKLDCDQIACIGRLPFQFSHQLHRAYQAVLKRGATFISLENLANYRKNDTKNAKFKLLSLD